MYYIKWVFNLKKKFDNHAIFYHVNINVKFGGSFHLLDLDWIKLLSLHENTCNLNGLGNFYYAHVLTFVSFPILFKIIQPWKQLSLLFFVDLDQVAKSKKLLHFQDEIIKRYTCSILTVQYQR